MASCTKIEHSLQSFIDGELADSERLNVEIHLHDCPTCTALLRDHKQCNAAMFDSFSEDRYCGDMTAYVMEHLPEMIEISNEASDLEQVNRRAKHPAALQEQFKKFLPLAAAFMIIGLGYILTENWPERAIPENALGAVTYQSGNVYRHDGETNERSAVELKTYARAGDSFEAEVDSTLLLTLLGPTHIKMSSDTRVHITDDRRIRVEKGRVFLDVAKANRMFRVFTPNGTVTVFGTSFEVNVDNDHLTVSVTEGQVQVEQDNLFKQLLPGQQISISQNASTMKPVTVDIQDIVQWSNAISPDLDAEQFFTNKIAVANVPEVVQADRGYFVKTRDHAIKSLELSWGPTWLTDSTNYHVYVYSDQEELMFKGVLNTDTLESRSDTSIEIMNRSNPDLRTDFAWVRIISEAGYVEEGLEFNVSAKLVK